MNFRGKNISSDGSAYAKEDINPYYFLPPLYVYNRHQYMVASATDEAYIFFPDVVPNFNQCNFCIKDLSGTNKGVFDIFVCILTADNDYFTW